MIRLPGVKQEFTALWVDDKGRILAAIAIGWGLVLGTRMIYPVLLPYLRSDFDLTLATAGLLISILWLAYALGQTPAGILIDRYGERTLMTVSIAMIVLGVICVLIARTPTLLFGATAFVGAGMSIFTIARITALSELHPDRLGGALGITMATGDVGQTVIPPLAGAIALYIAWQAGFGFIVPFLVLIGIFLWYTLPHREPTVTAVSGMSVEKFSVILGMIRQPATVIMGSVLFLFILVWQAFSAFYPTYLIEVKGLSVTAASALFGLFFAVGIVVKPIGGLAYDAIGARKVLPVILIGAVIGLFLLPSIDGLWPLAAITILIGFSKGSGAITQSYLANALPTEIQGTGLGVIRSTAATLGAAGPVLFGIAADFGYFNGAYMVLGGIIAIALLFTLRLPDN